MKIAVVTTKREVRFDGWSAMLARDDVFDVHH
jgi:hypothetical protein